MKKLTVSILLIIVILAGGLAVLKFRNNKAEPAAVLQNQNSAAENNASFNDRPVFLPLDSALPASANPAPQNQTSDAVKNSVAG